MKKILLITALLASTACSWVTLNEGGKNVALATLNDIGLCNKVGSVNAKTRFSIALGATRDSQKMNQELLTLARNEAATIQANTIVPMAPASEGQQSFTAYVCQ